MWAGVAAVVVEELVEEPFCHPSRWLPKPLPPSGMFIFLENYTYKMVYGVVLWLGIRRLGSFILPGDE